MHLLSILSEQLRLYSIIPEEKNDYCLLEMFVGNLCIFMENVTFFGMLDIEPM